MIVGCYSVHLYCDHPDAAMYVCTAWPGDFTGRTEKECLKEARTKGWYVRKGSGPVATVARAEKVRCPAHNDRRHP